eukprot:gene13936-19869_t
MAAAAPMAVGNVENGKLALKAIFTHILDTHVMHNTAYRTPFKDPDALQGSVSTEKYGMWRRQPGPGINESSKRRQSPGQPLLKSGDFHPGLVGRHAEVYWPDKTWYLVEIQDVNLEFRQLSVVYAMGETEVINIAVGVFETDTEMM